LGASPITEQTAPGRDLPWDQVKAQEQAKGLVDGPFEAVLGKTHRTEFQRGQRKRMDGLMTICHEARKGRYIGSHWPNHVRASALLDVHLFAAHKADSPASESLAMVNDD
jgi:hypothetical protein